MEGGKSITPRQDGRRMRMGIDELVRAERGIVRFLSNGSTFSMRQARRSPADSNGGMGSGKGER